MKLFQNLLAYEKFFLSEILESVEYNDNTDVSVSDKSQQLSSIVSCDDNDSAKLQNVVYEEICPETTATAAETLSTVNNKDCEDV